MAGPLSTLFDALHAEREHSWPREKLAANVAQRRHLVDSFDPAAVVRAGDAVASFELDMAGGPVTLDELLDIGPVLLIFFRFAGCPACNIALPHYDRTLVPELRRRGIAVIAVTPHLQGTGAAAIAERHGLSFPIATDRDNRLARRFGLTFVPEDAAPPPVDEPWVGSLTGTGTWELPQPALVLIGQDRRVRFADVSPDWLRRTEAETLLDSLEAVPTS